jgi:hypothetical protein
MIILKISENFTKNNTRFSTYGDLAAKPNVSPFSRPMLPVVYMVDSEPKGK